MISRKNMRIADTFKASVNLARPLSNVKNIALIILVFYLSKTNFNLSEILSALFSLSLVCSAFYAFNAFSDYDSDKNNENKKHYLEAVRYLGREKSFVIFITLLIFGFIIGFFINVYFLLFLTLLALTNFLYSSEYFRLKEKFILDILFGAFFTFLFRFCAFWYVFSYSFPPLLAVSALVLGKSAGYLLYKDLDYKYLSANKIKNSITILSKKAKIIISALLWFFAFLSFIFLCFNYYFKIGFLGSLPISFLLLIPFFIPPILIIYFSVLDKIKIPVKILRIWSIIYWLFAGLVIWPFL